MDPVRNIAVVRVSGYYNNVDTVITLTTGDGAKLPDPSVEGAYNLVWYNYTMYREPAFDPAYEIVRCIGRSSDTITVVRAQEGTSAQNHNIEGCTYRMVLAVTKKTIDDIVLALDNKFWGNGSPDYVPLFTNTKQLVNSNIKVNTTSSMVGINTSSPSAVVDIVPPLSSNVVFRTRSLQSIASLGSELVSNGSFSTVPDTYWTWGTGWTHDTVHYEADHSPGNTAALTQNISVSIDQIYIVEITIKNRTAGYITVDVGGVYIYNSGSDKEFSSNATYRRSFVADASGSATLRITPSSDFDGSVDDIHVKQVTNKSQPNFSLLDDEDGIMSELRGKGNQYNLALGANALCYNIYGVNNSAFGASTLYSNTTGFSNSAFGGGTLYANTDGYYNSAFGAAVLYSNTTGYNNSAFGGGTLFYNTTGYRNSALGASALYYNTTGYRNSVLGDEGLHSNTTGYNNSALGANAGKYVSGGGSNQTSTNSVYIGYDTRALESGDDNEIVIGASAVGVGSNSVVLGNDSITKTILKGNVGICTTAPSEKLTISGGNISLTAANSIITSSTGLTLQETGDIYGSSKVSIQNRDGVNGLLLEQAGSVDLYDLVFKSLNNQRNIRFEDRSNKIYAGDPEFQIGTANNPTLVISDSNSSFRVGSVGIGTTSPTAKLDIVPSSSSDVVFRTKSLQSTAPLGSELVSNGNFSTVPDTSWTWGTGWTHDTTNLEADHTTGNTAALTQNISVTNGQTYQVEITIRNRTAGSVTLNINGVYIYESGSSTALNSNGTFKRSLVANITGTATLSITPTSDFDGSVDDISVKQITSISQPNFNLLDDAGNVVVELRGKNSLANLALGVNALRYNTTGAGNSAIGTNTLYSNTTGFNNSAIGAYTLYFNTTGHYNSVIGTYALYSNTTGLYNSAVGALTLYSNTTGYYNSAVGANSLRLNTTGNNNSAVGTYALYANTTGAYNSAVGANALYSNTTGNSNSVLGYNALYSNTTGSNNSAVGASALYANTTGNNNSAIGYNAGRYIASGSNNQTSSNSVYLGYDTRAAADGDTNEIVIGYTAIGNGSNSATLGNDSITKTILKGNIGIGSTSPSAKLHVAGSTGYNQLRLQTSYTPTGTSDANGSTGDISWDDNYIYVKTSAGWKRAALSTW